MQSFRVRVRELAKDRPLQMLTIAAVVAATAAAAAPVRSSQVLSQARETFQTSVEQAVAQRPAIEPMQLVWGGADVDGDGKADFANPTGHAPREHDAYGSGAFGASRDGGSRRHEGVDFIADAGQTVVAPISGYVTKIGYAYAGDPNLRFVEINNPALKIEARAFYIDPEVQVGDTVAVGQPIGEVRSLQGKFPRGMTDHVHLEIIQRGRRINAERVITAEYVRGPING